SYKVGDLISGSQPWSRAVRMGGFQIRRNFASRPDLITFPTPAFDGKAVVASTIDVLINDAKVFSGETGAGPFVINNVPSIVGANMASIVVKDYLGRSVITTVPIYVDSRLLKEGLSDYSLEAGWLRSSYGTDSFDYGQGGVASVSYSYGYSKSFTVQGHAEASSKLANLGIGAVVLLPAVGVLSGNISGST
ncbi:MAG: fimbria/pilus outer membrane usher protein, partial [Pseudomonadales bacterium]